MKQKKLDNKLPTSNRESRLQRYLENLHSLHTSHVTCRQTCDRGASHWDLHLYLHSLCVFGHPLYCIAISVEVCHIESAGCNLSVPYLKDYIEINVDANIQKREKNSYMSSTSDVGSLDTKWSTAPSKNDNCLGASTKA